MNANSMAMYFIFLPSKVRIDSRQQSRATRQKRQTAKLLGGCGRSKWGVLVRQVCGKQMLGVVVCGFGFQIRHDINSSSNSSSLTNTGFALLTVNPVLRI